MKVLRVAQKTLVELWREPMHLALMLFFPIILVLFYYVAFGQTESAGIGAYLRVLVLNRDTSGAGEQLVAAMDALEFEGKPVLDVDMVASEEDARIALLERKAALLVIVPPDLGDALAGASRGVPRASPAVVEVVGDPGSDTFVFARSFLAGLIREFTFEAAAVKEDGPVLTYEFLAGTGTMSDFDFGVPGTIVFGIAFAIITTPIALVREKVGGTLQRLRLTRLGAGALLAGVTLASGVLVPLVFLSGAVFPLPAVSLGTVAGHDVQVYDLLPTTHGAEALRRVLVFGDGAGVIAYELVALAVLSAAILAAGVVLYRRLQMQRG
ncbi:MAG: ABC transporter permease [Anaerolineae bacterium]|nr:ABC transporter permease [Anaerolineae bacterium]